MHYALSVNSRFFMKLNYFDLLNKYSFTNKSVILTVKISFFTVALFFLTGFRTLSTLDINY